MTVFHELLSNKTALTIYGVTWTGGSTASTSKRWYDVIWDGSKYIAVGEGWKGSTQYTLVGVSADGVSWDYYYPTPQNLLPRSVKFNGSQYVMVGAGGSYVSVDGINWTHQPIPVQASQLNSLVWTGTYWIAVGDSQILRSPDGINWTVVSTVASGFDVAWDGTKLVSVNGTVIYSSNDQGTTWTAGALPVGAGTGTNYSIITWDGTQFVMDGADSLGTLVATSATGVGAWTVVSTATTNYQNRVVSSHLDPVTSTWRYVTQNNKISGVGSGPWVNQPTWNSTASRSKVGGSASNGATIVFTNYDGLTQGQSSKSNLITGYDLVTTAVRTSGFSVTDNDTYYDLFWTGSTYIAGCAGGAVLVSADVNSWAAPAGAYPKTAAAGDIVDIAIGNGGVTIAAMTSAGVIASQNGGVSWTGPYNVGTTLGRGGIVYDAPRSKWIAVGTNGAQNTSILTANASGVASTQWTSRGGIIDDLHAVASGPAAAVAVGAGGAIHRTVSGGNTWTKTNTTGTMGTDNLNDIIWADTQFVAVGDSGRVFTSPDGSTGTWTWRTSGTANNLEGVVSVGGQLIAVGSSGTIITSLDGGATWTTRSSGSNYDFKSVTWDGAQLVAFANPSEFVISIP